MIYHLDQWRLVVMEAIALLVGLVLHGVAQAAACSALGDRTGASAGRLVPDPRRQLDPFGVVAAVIANVGWGKPVPMREFDLRRRRGRFVLGVLAGPFANLLLAFACFAGARLAGVSAAGLLEASGTGGFVRELLLVGGFINVQLGVLQLFPLPPLDGARVMWALAPPTEGWRRARYQLEERNIGVAILLVLLLLPLVNRDPIGLVLLRQLSRPFLRILLRVTRLF